MRNKIKKMIRLAVKEIVLFLNGMFLDVLSLLSVAVQADLFCTGIRKVRIDRSKDIIVIGCGPSLSATVRENGDFFTGKTKICVNDFAVFEHFASIKPEFYVLFDTAYWERDLSDELRDSNERIFKSLQEVSWPVTMIMPLVAKDWNWFLDLPRLNKNISICYVNWTKVECFKGLKYFFYRRHLAMPYSVNVLIHAVFLAINLGAGKIFIVGADHSWHENVFVGQDNLVYYKYGHFYAEETLSLAPAIKNHGGKEIFKMHELFRFFASSFEGHWEMADYARHRGVQVYNASKKSCIDAYARVSLSQGMASER